MLASSCSRRSYFLFQLLWRAEICCRISNSSPFLENENQKSIKERILKRRIVWEPLKERHPSEDGNIILLKEPALYSHIYSLALNFIYSLLQSNPNHRMSIAQSLHHPWLESHTPFHPPDFDEFQRTYEMDARMSISHIGFGEDIGFGPHEPGGHHGGSPTSALRRRKDVIAQADEGRVLLPEPSSEMVANITRQGPSTPVRSQNKRVREQLSVLPEDSLAYVYAEADARHAAAAAANLNANANVPMDGGGASDGRRRSGRRTKAPRRA